MLQSLLKKIFCENLSFDMDKLAEFLELYEVNDYIYPSALKKYVDVSAEKTYEILSELEKNHLVKLIYIVECFDCQRNIQVFDEIWQIKNVSCGECDNELAFPDNVKVAYKVVLKWN